MEQVTLCTRILIPMTGYVSLIFSSTSVATASRSTIEVTMWADATVTKGREATTHAAASKYPHSTLNSTATCSSSNTV